MKWITWEHIAVDRMACIWLIRRWIDPRAEFAFVPAGTRPLPRDGEPFDIPGTRYSHRRGHCSFHALLKGYKLKDPLLERISRMVDEADVVQDVNVEAAAPGLDLICRGLRAVSQDDLQALERGCLVYDALYAQLQADSVV
jgi:hypothetical protein